MELTPVDRAVLHTVTYADLFDCALRLEEVHCRLIRLAASLEDVTASVERLAGTYLAVREGLIAWNGREELFAIHRDRRAHAEQLWPIAERYVRWLQWVPFVRGVAVSGSLAADNPSRDADIDLFWIAAPGRLWVARALIGKLSAMTRRRPRSFPVPLCPSYALALDSLQVPTQNLFTAYESMLIVPVLAPPLFEAFRRVNPWASVFLPNQSLASRAPLKRPTPWPTRAAEWALRGRFGDALDRLVHRLVQGRRTRLAREAGRSEARVRDAMTRGRSILAEGGYAHVIAERFETLVRERLGGDPGALFHERGPGPDAVFSNRFHTRYGTGLAFAAPDTDPVEAL